MRGGEGRLVSSRGVGRRAASVSRRGWRDLIAFRGGRGRTGSGRCPKGVVRDTAGRAVDGWRAGIVAFAINGRCREGEYALPRRWQVCVDSDRSARGVWRLRSKLVDRSLKCRYFEDSPGRGRRVRFCSFSIRCCCAGGRSQQPPRRVTACVRQPPCGTCCTWTQRKNAKS